MVSKTQYASLVSAISSPSHLICRCLVVCSKRGGRGKLRGFSGGFGGIILPRQRLIVRDFYFQISDAVPYTERLGIWSPNL